jgi:hypothetical protein
MKIKYVAQKDPCGCAVACISMVTGIPYDKVAARLEADLSKNGLASEITRNFVTDAGFSVIEAIAHGYNMISQSNKRMARPFADIHIVSVLPFADSEFNHAVVMDKRGRIYDPDSLKRKDLSHYYYIVRVQGYFDDRAKRR